MNCATLFDFAACGNLGLSGESYREYPPGYLMLYDGFYRNIQWHMMPRRWTVAVRRMVRRGWLEPRVRVVDVPETIGTGFLDCPAHRLFLVSYHLTEAGHEAWLRGC